MTATLIVRREGFGVELRRGTFQVVLDEHDLGVIEWKEEREWPIEAGRHSLVIRAGRYSSPPRSFDVADAQGVIFRCHGALIWPLYVASFFRPDLAISLRHE